MSNLFFHIKEWLTLDGTEAKIPLTAEQSQKIFEYHLLPLNIVRDEMDMPVHVRSGYRPEWFEHMKGRDGSSQHCFRELGATDVSIEKTSSEPFKPADYWLKFFRLLKETPYKRIAYYPDLRFFHCDLQGTDRKYYISRQGWEHVTSDDVGQLIRTNQNGN